MTEEKPRKLKVLEELAKFTSPVGAAEIAGIIGESARDVGKDLYDSGKGGLAQKPDEKKSLWLITDKGKKYIENPPVPSAGPLAGPSARPSAGPSARPSAEETPDTGVPNQADILQYYGEKLRVGIGRGGKTEGTPLDAIIFFVQQTADLNDLNSVWNAFTKMAVPSDIKRRWIELYAHSLPGKEIPEELKEKLEMGQESEKIKTEGEGIPPKPKRFSVVGGEIIGDPEGDLSFKEALQLSAQQKGAPSEAVNPLATMVEAMKMGPEMATSMLTTLIPLINKEPPQPSGERDTQIDMLEKLDKLGMLKKSGEEDAGSETVRALQTEVKELKESLQKQEMDTVKSAVVALSNQVTDLRKEIANGGKLEGRYALMDKTIGVIDSQVSGLRSDARPFFDALTHRGGGPGPSQRSPEDKARIAKELKKAVGAEQEAHALEDELLFGVKPQPEETATAPPASSASAVVKLHYE